MFRVLFGCNSTFEHPDYLNRGRMMCKHIFIEFWGTLWLCTIRNQHLPGKNCKIEKNPIMISPYSIFEVDKVSHDQFF
jgi:hypothetical protein